MKTYKELSKKYISTNKKRSIITILAIILSTAVMVSFSMIYSAQEKNTQESAKEQLGYYDVKFQGLTNEQYKKLVDDSRVENVAKARFEGVLVRNREDGIKTNFDFIRLTDESIKNIFNFDLMQGRLPKDENEIIVDYTQLPYLGSGVNIDSEVQFNQYANAEANSQDEFIYATANSTIDNEAALLKCEDANKVKESKKEVKYKIVGIVRNITGKSKIYGYINDEELLKGGVIDTYATLKNNMSIGYGGMGVGQEKLIAEDLGIKFLMREDGGEGILGSQVKYPDITVVDTTGQGIDSGNATLIIMIVSLFMFGTVFNIFNISILERVRHLGILRAIGGTKDQISKIIGRESNFYCLVGIPLGVLVGFLASKLIVFGINIFMNVNFGMQDISINMSDMLLIIIESMITVKMSARFAIRKQVNMTPVEAINTFTSESNSKIRMIGKNKFIDEKGKIEVKLAHKNLSRNIIRNNICILSMAVSMILFMVFTNAFVTGLKNVKTTTPSKNWDVEILANGNPLDENVIAEFSKINGVNNVYLNQKTEMGIPVKKDIVGSTLSNAYEGDKYYGLLKEYKGYYTSNVTIRLVTEKELELYKEYLSEGTIDYNKLNENGVLLVNSGIKRIITGSNGAGVMTKDENTDRLLNVNVGDELKVPSITGLNSAEAMKAYYSDQEVNEEGFIPFKINGILSEDALRDNYDKRDASEMSADFKLIMTKECYEKNFSIPINYGVVIETSDTNREDTINKIRELTNKNSNDFRDYKELAAKKEKAINESLAIQVAFIVTLVVIVVVNVANNFYGNIIMRKKELASMRAIGMDHDQMKKMVLSEMILIAFESCVWALTVGGGITLFNQLNLRRIGMGRLDIWFICVILSVITIIILSIISVINPLSKLKGLNIVEEMRGEE